MSLRSAAASPTLSVWTRLRGPAAYVSVASCWDSRASAQVSIMKYLYMAVLHCK